MTHSTSSQALPRPLRALFVSDVHLCKALPKTTQRFFDFLNFAAAQAETLYLLGDLFEYWAGDDDMPEEYNQTVLAAIRAVSERGCQVFWMAGNRDFLVGEKFAEETKLTLLNDPSTVTFGEMPIVLTHGDAQCTDDLAYMAFRQMVRQSDWLKNFLTMPLAQRKAIIEGMRKESVQGQKTKDAAIMDVNEEAIRALFAAANVSLMIHGHTHRPAVHTYSDKTRFVLPDWECDSEPEKARGGWISIDMTGQITRHSLEELPTV